MIDPKKNNSFEQVKESAPTGKNYRMYDPITMKGQRIWDELLEKAQKINIWDPFFNTGKDHEFFQSVKTEGVEIDVLTLNPNKDYSHDDLRKEARKLRNNIIKILEGNKIQKFSVTVRGIDQVNFRDWREGFATWHDRYLLTDEGVYLMGTSMTGQLEGGKLYGIHKLEHQDDEKVVTYYYLKYHALSHNRKYGFCISK